MPRTADGSTGMPASPGACRHSTPKNSKPGRAKSERSGSTKIGAFTDPRSPVGTIMARLKLDLPVDQFCYSTHLTVRVTEINAANHLANDSMISMISEARARFLYEYGSEGDRVDGAGIIVTDLATMYRNEAHARDQLLFEVGVMDFNKYGGDIIFRI